MRIIVSAACAVALAACQTSKDPIGTVIDILDLASDIAIVVAGDGPQPRETLLEQKVREAVQEYCRATPEEQARIVDETSPEDIERVVELYGGLDGDVCTPR